MRNKIWYEMVHTKLGEIYLSKYIGRKKEIRKWYKLTILIFSGGGVLGWKIWSYAPVLACVLVSVMQIMNLVQNQIVLSDGEMDNISELRTKYIFYFNKLERLWIDFNSNKIAEDIANEQFYELRTLASEMESLDNKLEIITIKSLYDKSHIETNNYINQYHS